MPPVTQEPKLNERIIPTSAGMETATQTVAREQEMLKPTVSAEQLTQGVPAVTLPEPQQPSIPAGTLNVARNVSRNAQGFIEAQTAEQARLRELQSTFGSLSEQGSLSDFFQAQREQFGATPENLQELQDIQLRLNDMDTESGVTQTRIEGAAGQTLGQAGREVTQEQRENAVRSAGLAARAAVIQGNINTATQLARDAVNIEYQQRTLTAQNLLQQISIVQGQVDDQTAQLLEEERRGYEAELATIKEVKDSVATAMVNGASQAEIAQLTSDELGDAEKIALAQSITARGAGEMRDLQVRQAESNLLTDQAQRANIYDQIDARQRALREAAAQAVTEQEKQEIEKTQKSEQLLGIQQLLNDVGGMKGMSSAVGFGVKKTILDKIPFVSGDALEGTARADFEVAAGRLSDMFLVQNLDKMTGVLTDKDLEVLRAEGTTIGNFNQSEDAWLKEKARLDAMVARGIAENGITPEQAVYYGVIDGNDAETLDAIWNNL